MAVIYQKLEDSWGHFSIEDSQILLLHVCRLVHSVSDNVSLLPH